MLDNRAFLPCFGGFGMFFAQFLALCTEWLWHTALCCLILSQSHLRVPPLPLNPVLQLGFAKLKNLANQEIL